MVAEISLYNVLILLKNLMPKYPHAMSVFEKAKVIEHYQGAK